MKAGAKRRRTKAEIEQQKLDEQSRLANIEQKMQQFNEMQEELQRLRQNQADFAHADQAIIELREAGLVRQGENGGL